MAQSTAEIDAEIKALYDKIKNVDKAPNMSVEELVKFTKDSINHLIQTDPYLHGLPLDPTIEEVRAQKALTLGQAIVIYLDRGPFPTLSIVVPSKDATVMDLKRAVKRQTNLALQRENIKKKISWKHVWKRHYLSFDGVKLTDDNDKIHEYGIRNKATIKYVKKRREKK
ncbi:hypothetical protein QAD02_018819 [Eretmocerus hayati]|uniref:Uncharacterized protein n=1 Tax=Eretmocerus hayati TaxID=131215 RepID=A0ACC2PHT7_9HYME|nr:hypothetical protein QAD02_018819 [Eretmocerus hayati]